MMKQSYAEKKNAVIDLMNVAGYDRDAIEGSFFNKENSKKLRYVHDASYLAEKEDNAAKGLTNGELARVVDTILVKGLKPIASQFKDIVTEEKEKEGEEKEEYKTEYPNLANLYWEALTINGEQFFDIEKYQTLSDILGLELVVPDVIRSYKEKEAYDLLAEKLGEFDDDLRGGLQRALGFFADRFYDISIALTLLPTNYTGFSKLDEQGKAAIYQKLEGLAKRPNQVKIVYGLAKFKPHLVNAITSALPATARYYILTPAYGVPSGEDKDEVPIDEDKDERIINAVKQALKQPNPPDPQFGENDGVSLEPKQGSMELMGSVLARLADDKTDPYKAVSKVRARNSKKPNLQMRGLRITNTNFINLLTSAYSTESRRSQNKKGTGRASLANRVFGTTPEGSSGLGEGILGLRKMLYTAAIAMENEDLAEGVQNATMSAQDVRDAFTETMKFDKLDTKKKTQLGGRLLENAIRAISQLEETNEYNRNKTFVYVFRNASADAIANAFGALEKSNGYDKNYVKTQLTFGNQPAARANWVETAMSNPVKTIAQSLLVLFGRTLNNPRDKPFVINKYSSLRVGGVEMATSKTKSFKTLFSNVINKKSAKALATLMRNSQTSGKYDKSVYAKLIQYLSGQYGDVKSEEFPPSFDLYVNCMNLTRTFEGRAGILLDALVTLVESKMDENGNFKPQDHKFVRALAAAVNISKVDKKEIDDLKAQIEGKITFGSKGAKEATGDLTVLPKSARRKILSSRGERTQGKLDVESFREEFGKTVQSSGRLSGRRGEKSKKSTFRRIKKLASKPVSTRVTISQDEPSSPGLFSGQSNQDEDALNSSPVGGISQTTGGSGKTTSLSEVEEDEVL